MEGAYEKIVALLQTGSTFTYGNVGTKSQYGNIAAYSPDWIAWRARVDGAIKRLFTEGSSPVEMVDRGNMVTVIGNGTDMFELAKSYYLGALEAAKLVIQDDTFGEIQGSPTTSPSNYSNRVFVVHGHDENAKQELEILLSEIGLEAVVLHRQPDGGRTIIEKFEHYADVGYAFVLMTPDEIAYLVAEEGKADGDRAKENRARPNVIFEFGYFVGKLGRSRTCCIYKGNVSVPSDLSGLIYKKFSKNIEEIGYSIIKELKAAGYKIKVE